MAGGLRLQFIVDTLGFCLEKLFRCFLLIVVFICLAMFAFVGPGFHVKFGFRGSRSYGWS